ncbi:MAG: hypothetical protein ACTSXP_03020, partial [Promethearchaeota archaeon]
MEDPKFWLITFDGEDPGPSDDFTLKFIDCSYLVGEPLLKQKFLKDLIALVEEHDHYNIIGNIKEIIDDAGKNLSDKNMYTLLGILKNGLKIGFLLGNIVDKGKDLWHVAALWPFEFAAAVDKNLEYFVKSLILFVDKPEQWTRVDLIIPILKKKSDEANLS